MSEEELVKYVLNFEGTTTELIVALYNKGRADAIEEFSEEIEYSFKLNGGIVIEDIERLAEQLKEQNK